MQAVKAVVHFVRSLQFCIREFHQLVASIDLEVQATLEYADRLDLDFSLLDSNDSKVLSTVECVSCLPLVSKMFE